MNTNNLAHLTPANRRLLEDRFNIRELSKIDIHGALFRRCTIRLLLVTDRLSFSPSANFGLGTFVKILLDSSIWGQVQITLANIGPWRSEHADFSLTSESRVTTRIDNFRFDNTSHFDPAKFDAIFLFGITSSYAGGPRGGETLDDSEIAVLNAFQNSGGGLFATGDHGSLGRALCSKLARAREMRHWDSFPDATDPNNQVSMEGQWRNDTNVFNAGSNNFDDQSDDVPQAITPRFYSRRTGIFRIRFPHPLLCGPNGVIRVMPDHPHEGQCKNPKSLDQAINVNGADTAEFPPATLGGIRPTPEIISWNRVAANRTSSSKDPTLAHSFPGIAAYDGHRAKVGRVVTDSTWHHFVNVNLIGMDGVEPPDPFATGFLASASGQAAFEEIKAYFRNLMIWLCRPATITCLRSKLLLDLVVKDRVLEAVLSAERIGLDRLSPKVLSIIGLHARDVLGRFAGRCQSMELIIDLIKVEWRPIVDPWVPIDPDPPIHNPVSDDPDIFPLVDFSPILDAALGGALVALAHELGDEAPERLAKIKAEKVFDAARKGAAVAIDKSLESFDRSLAEVQSSGLFDRGADAR